jgi:hypothetical protein
MPLKRETYADCLGRAAYARVRAAAAKTSEEARDWQIIASEWMAVAATIRQIEESGGPSLHPNAAE